MAKELDFENEARNASRCRADLASLGTLRVNGALHVPWVDLTLTSKRVLTAEYIDGIKINQVSLSSIVEQIENISLFRLFFFAYTFLNIKSYNELL